MTQLTERAGSRERRDEFNSILAIIRLARTATDTTIAGGEQERASTGANLRKGVADTGGVVQGYSLLIVSVGSAKHVCKFMY